MNIKFIFLILLFIPSIAFADEVKTYEGLAGLASAIGVFFTDIWEFFNSDLPTFIERAMQWILKEATLFMINAQIESMEFAWSVAKSVMESFQISSKITAASSALPPDVQAAVVDMRLFDAVNIIIQAYISRYVLRFL